MQTQIAGDWSLERTCSEGGHTDVVRGCTVDLASGNIATSGEDGQICLWSVNLPSRTDVEDSAISTSPSVPLKVRLGEIVAPVALIDYIAELGPSHLGCE